MQIQALKTRIYNKEEDLISFILEHVQMNQNDILLVTSKIVSLSERQVKKRTSIHKTDLIKEESDFYLSACAYDCHLTIKHGLLIPSAGIDESNSEESDYILYPKDPFQSAKTIHHKISEKIGFKNWGLILTDSHTQPLRQGVTGVALSYYGFNGVRSLKNQPDLFGRSLQFTQQNIADSLSSSAVLLMGEGAESRPLALIKEAPVEFIENKDNSEIHINPYEDLYYPLYKSYI